MIIGTNANMNRDRFTIEKFSHLQKNVVEVINFAGYRNGHSAVQVGHHLYVLGGKDAKGNILDRVSVRSDLHSVKLYRWRLSMSNRFNV